MGWTVLAMDLESRGRTWKEPKMGDDVQHGQKDAGQKAQTTLAAGRDLSGESVLITSEPE